MKFKGNSAVLIPILLHHLKVALVELFEKIIILKYYSITIIY